MQRSTAKVFGFLALGLGLVGLVSGEKQLFDFLNVDIVLDVARIALAALLLYAVYGARNNDMIRGSLVIFSLAYIGLGLLGLISRDVFGALPHELSVFDIAFHLLSGVAVLGIALGKGEREHKATN